MFANTSSPSMSFGFPDVCKTIVGPAIVPIPYPNIAMSAMAIPTVLNVFIMAMPVHNLMTMTPLTNGDNAGIAGGLISQIMMGPSKHLKGSVKVFKSGMPTTRMLDPTGQNGMLPNVPGITLSPSQVKTLIMT
jgi:hypothetical protein